MRREIFILALAGICLEILFLNITCLGNLREHVVGFIVLDLVAFIPYTFCIFYLRNNIFPEHISKTLLKLIIIFSVLFRITLLFSEPSLSDDIYRYLWDGKMLNHGINPYQYPPGTQAQEVIGLRDSGFSFINHKDIGTVYGPLAIIIFSIAERISHTVISMKSLFVLFDMGIIYLVFLILRKYKISTLNILIYAWSPLVIIEIAGSGHNDSLAVFFLLTAIYFWKNKNNTLSALNLALSIFSKYFSVIFLPFYLKKAGMKDVMMLLSVTILMYVPFYSYLENHLFSIITFGLRWRFNDSFFAVLFNITGSLFISKVIIISIFVVFYGWVFLKDWDIIKSFYFLIGASLLLTTTLHPWYLIWIIPFLCFYPNAAWLLLTALIALSYQVLIGYNLNGIWTENYLFRWLEYIPFYSMLVGGYFVKNFKKLREAVKILEDAKEQEPKTQMEP